MTTSSVASLRPSPTMAVYGLACIFLYVVPAIVFLLPTSLVSAELASGYEGGVYNWVARGISEPMGFLAVWWVSGTATGRTPPVPSASGSPAPRFARCTRWCAWRSRQASTQYAPGSAARRSTEPHDVSSPKRLWRTLIHRAGHGIGATTHEPPYMVEGEEQPLVPGWRAW
jgi:hypothetical protein